MNVSRIKIFISYSHEDSKWLEKLKKMYTPINNGALWDDSKIQPGMKWKEEIKKALASAKIAVLLVSDNFLSSKFIINDELPPLLEAAEKEGLIIFWIYLTSCMYKRTQIANYKAAHDVSKPLDMLDSPQQNEMLVKICEELDKSI
jgi:hypothetical protein